MPRRTFVERAGYRSSVARSQFVFVFCVEWCRGDSTARSIVLRERRRLIFVCFYHRLALSSTLETP